MTEQQVRNLLMFMERTPVTGLECFAWCEAYATLKMQLQPVIQKLPPNAVPQQTNPALDMLGETG